MQNSHVLFSARKVVKQFGRFTALHGIDLDLQRGDFLSLFGANGAGKTTFLSIASSLVLPTSGNVLIDGKDISEHPMDIKSRIGYIAHNTFLYNALTARENLRFYSTLYNIQNAEEAIDRNLAAVGLEKRADDQVRDFSRGMQQRLTIARAFLHAPSLLLLDEPYTGLDTHASDILNNLLRKLNTERCAVILVTHNIDQGYDIASKVAIINKGRMKLNESTADISREDFKSTYREIVSG